MPQGWRQRERWQWLSASRSHCWKSPIWFKCFCIIGKDDRMKTRLFHFLALPVLLLSFAVQLGWAEQPKDAAKEEAALQKRAEAFVEVFNNGDAKALAAFLTRDGDMVDTEGNHLKGRKAIEEAYQKLFAKTKGAKLFIRITS